MRLAISNIAWNRDEEELVAGLLRELGVRHVEVAPTKRWAAPLDAGPDEVAEYRRFWERFGISIVAVQSPLFGRPDLIIFGDDATRRATFEYLSRTVSVAAQLGASVIVFGSPGNRRAGDVPKERVGAIAEEFFHRLGDVAAGYGVFFCLEPNPREYGCDFVTTADEGIGLVNRVNSPGFCLHLDAAGMRLAGDDAVEAIPKAMPILRHFHISSPFLGPIGAHEGDHVLIASTLRGVGYPHVASIEMKAVSPGSNVEQVVGAVTFAGRVYGGLQGRGSLSRP